MIRFATRSLHMTCLFVLLFTFVACDEGTRPTQEEIPFMTTPPVGSPAVLQTPGAGGGAPNGTSTAPAPVRIAASNLTFDKSELVASAGAIKFEFDNNDPNVTHNFAVFRDASDTSTPLGATPITSGPDEQTLNITLDRGEYYFQCQVHPDMNGKLVVR